ncbi:MAG: hypothetical protein AAF950_16530 [Pseudomonadota bacterium]
MENIFHGVKSLCRSRMVLAAAIAGFFTASAYAQSAPAANSFTEAGRQVENTFTLNYDVNGTSQDTITNDDSRAGEAGVVVQGTPTEFTVDRVIDHIVQSLNAATGSPGANADPLIFRLTNTGNDNQAYTFSVENLTGDDFDLSNFTLEFGVGADPAAITSFQPLNQFTRDNAAAAPFVAAGGGATTLTTDVPPDNSLIIRVVGEVDGAAIDAQTGDVLLVAEARQPETFRGQGTAGFSVTTAVRGEDMAADTGGNTVASVAENVLADGDGNTGTPGTFDEAFDGFHSAPGTVTANVAAPVIAAEKIVTVLATDPDSHDVSTTAIEACQNFTTSAIPAASTATPAVAQPAPAFTPDTTSEPYSVPGACVEYLIRVQNNTPGATGVPTTTASNVAIEDFLPAQVEFVSARAEGFNNATQPAQDVTGSVTPPNCNRGGATPALTSCAVRFAGATVNNDNIEAAIRIRALVR